MHHGYHGHRVAGNAIADPVRKSLELIAMNVSELSRPSSRTGNDLRKCSLDGGFELAAQIRLLLIVVDRRIGHLTDGGRMELKPHGFIR